MKIIKIESCDVCQFFGIRWSGGADGGCVGECGYTDLMISDPESIPNWCPLDDELNLGRCPTCGRRVED